MSYPIENNFKYHTPKGNKVERYQQMREQFKMVAEFVINNTPASREQSVALTNIEQACMWANAAIARNE